MINQQINSEYSPFGRACSAIAGGVGISKDIYLLVFQVI